MDLHSIKSSLVIFLSCRKKQKAMISVAMQRIYQLHLIILYALCLLYPQASSSAVPAKYNLYPQSNNASMELSKYLQTSNLSQDIVDLLHPIPDSHPPRYLQISYNKEAQIDHSASVAVISTILSQVQQHVTRYGDGPMFPSLYEYHVLGCSSSTIAIPRMRAAVMTFSMLREVMLALRTIFEEQGKFYEAFYDLIDQGNIPWAEGSLLRAPEPMLQRLNSSSS